MSTLASPTAPDRRPAPARSQLEARPGPPGPTPRMVEGSPFQQLLDALGLSPSLLEEAPGERRPAGSEPEPQRAAELPELPGWWRSEPPAPGQEPAGAARHTAVPSADLQRLADLMLRQVRVMTMPNELALQLQVELPALRAVSIELRLHRGRVSARLQAGNRAGLHRLRAAAPELEAALRERGICADPVEVCLEGTGPSRGVPWTGAAAGP